VSEREIHQAIVDWLKVALPDGSVFHHSPNEGRHKVQYRMQQKRLGVRAGWPDIEIFVNPTWWRGTTPWAPVFLEIKTAKGRLSDNQKQMIGQLTGAGCYVAVVRSIDEARVTLMQYVELRDG
jgi:hypothetical protein